MVMENALLMFIMKQIVLVKKDGEVKTVKSKREHQMIITHIGGPLIYGLQNFSEYRIKELTKLTKKDIDPCSSEFHSAIQ